MAHGKTNLMRNIRKPAPKWVHRHEHPAGRDRRHGQSGYQPHARGKRFTVPKADRPPALNEPYVNLLRDLKPGARLRPEYRDADLARLLDLMGTES